MTDYRVSFKYIDGARVTTISTIHTVPSRMLTAAKAFAVGFCFTAVVSGLLVYAGHSFEAKDWILVSQALAGISAVLVIWS